MLNPLWLPGNSTLDSAIFEVKESFIVSLFAVGLEKFKVRQDSKSSLSPQAICVNRLLYERSEGEPTRAVGPAMNFCDCGFVFEGAWASEIILVEETVTSNGCPWQLTQCNNFHLIGIPGVYRLHLNDDTAIGKVQVYAEEFAIQNIPSQTAGLFFS